MKKYIPLIFLTFLAGCSSNESQQSYYLGKAIKSVQDGDCSSANIQLTKLRGRTEASDENLANAALIESSCYLNGDIIDANYARGGYEYIVEKYPNTKAGHIAKTLLSDWDNVANKKITIKSTPSE